MINNRRKEEMNGLDFKPDILLCFLQSIFFAFSDKSAAKCTASDTCNNPWDRCTYNIPHNIPDYISGKWKKPVDRGG